MPGSFASGGADEPGWVRVRSAASALSSGPIATSGSSSESSDDETSSDSGWSRSLGSPPPRERIDAASPERGNTPERSATPQRSESAPPSAGGASDGAPVSLPSVIIVEPTPSPTPLAVRSGWSSPFTPSRSQVSGRKSDGVVKSSGGWPDFRPQAPSASGAKRSPSPTRSVLSPPPMVAPRDDDPAASGPFSATPSRSRTAETDRTGTPALSTEGPSPVSYGRLAGGLTPSASATPTQRSVSLAAQEAHEDVTSSPRSVDLNKTDIDEHEATDSVQGGFSDTENSDMRASDSVEHTRRAGGRGWCTGVVLPAAVLLLVAAGLAHEHLPGSPLPKPAIVMQQLPARLTAIGKALASAPIPAARPPPCNISYAGVPGPGLYAIAAAQHSGMLWGLGSGVQVVTEPWMETVPPQRKDALWACGTEQQPCTGKWRLLDAPPAQEALAAGASGNLYTVDKAGRMMRSTKSEEHVALAVTSGWPAPADAAGPIKPAIAVSPSAVWALAPSGALHRCPQPCSDASLQKAPEGRYRAVSADPVSGALWAVNPAGGALTCDGTAACLQSAGWKAVAAPVPLQSVTATATAIRGIAADGAHLKCNAPCTGRWRAVPGRTGRLAEGGNRLWHLTDGGALAASKAC